LVSYDITTRHKKRRFSDSSHSDCCRYI